MLGFLHRFCPNEGLEDILLIVNRHLSTFKRKQGNNLDKVKENISELKQPNVFMHCLEGNLKNSKETEK